MKESRHEGGGVLRSKPAWAAAAILASVLVYALTLSHPFLHDDLTVIGLSPIVQQRDRALEAFRTDYWAMRREDKRRDRLYRPITILSLTMNHALGGNAPEGYRAVNIAAHAVAVLLLFWLCLRFGLDPPASGAVALLFALHPVHTEAVNAVVGRADLFAAIGVFSGMGVMLKWAFPVPAPRTEETSRRKGRRKPAVASAENAAGNVLPALLTALSFALALFSKEIGAAFVFWAALWWAWRRWAEDGKALPDRRSALWIVAGLAVVLAVYLALRYGALGMWVRPGLPSRLDNPLAHADLAGRWVGALGVLGRSLALMVWPWPLSIDYSCCQILPYAKASFFWAGFGIAAMAAWAAAAWRWRASAPGAAFGLGLFLAAYLPVGNFVVPIGTVMAERLFYLPSAGFLIAAVALASARFEARNRRVLAAGGIVLVAFAALTWVRNGQWATPLRLWASAARVSPRSARALRLYGQSLYAQGRAKEAIVPLKEATRVFPSYDPAWVDLGIAQLRSNREAEAEVSLRRAVRLNPDTPEGWLSLGVLMLGTGRPAEARRYLEKAVALSPRLVEARFNLGTLYLRQGNRTGAVEQFRAALRVDPRRGDVHHNLAIALFMGGDAEGARRHARRAVRLGVRLHPELAKRLGIPANSGSRR